MQHTVELNRKKPPFIKDAIDFDLKLKPYQKYTLKNGAEVYAIDAGAEEVMQLECVFFAGNWFENKNLVAASTNFLLKNGTRHRSAFQINEHFEYYGSYLNRNCYNETATLSVHCLSKHFKELLPVIQELLTDSVFPEQEITTYQQNMKQRLNVNLKKSDFVATRLIDACLYGESHPYGRYSRFEDFDSLTREDLQEFYAQRYVNGKFIVFASGKLPADLYEVLNASLGDLKNGTTQIPFINAQPAPEKKYRITNDPNGVQGSIRMGAPFPNRHHPDFLKAQVLNNIFGGYFGSRLMSNIREEKGYTYGIHSYLENHLQQSAWVISTEAGRDVCEAALAEVYKEMETICREPVDAEELLLVQNYMMGLILGDLDGPFHIINRWKNIILNGLSHTYFDEQIQTIKHITPDDIQRLANQYLLPKNFYELIVV